ncbi:MAG: sigma-54 dependent transcriptional regulator [Bacteroidales bacterium]|nr:sigma-54 dependent transcriptional regulator [Bacteroidales bacterium]
MDSQDLQRIKNKFDIIGNDAGLNRAIETAVAVAPYDLPVLICGESGTGKDVIPRIIHQYSRRRNGKYLAINCGGLPEGTINSELFGHEKGSFTGATEARKGYFEEADGGTLFLDEVGDLPSSTQAMLLRVLQNGEYLKVGSSKVSTTDVRIITATNVNLPYAVSRGRFREDLYYRLNSIQVNMPSLRERKDDIYLLFRKFTSDFSEKYRASKVTLSHEAISLLQNYRWPGNVRQLKSIADSVSAMETIGRGDSEKTELSAAALARYIPEESNDCIPVPADLHGQEDRMSPSDKQMFVKALLDLKREVDDLKRAVFGSGGGHPMIPARDYTPAPEHSREAPEEAEWQENQAVQEPANLSLHKAEEENIRKALEKYNGNRKLAARELGISERTLYRRISSK